MSLIIDKIIAISKVNQEIIDRIESAKGTEFVTKKWNKLAFTNDIKQSFSIDVQTETTEGQ